MLSIAEMLLEFERQAGYTERSLALVQALVELNCFCPPTLRNDAEATRGTPQHVTCISGSRMFNRALHFEA